MLGMAGIAYFFLRLSGYPLASLLVIGPGEPRPLIGG
jgi:hypothetical protein